MASASKSAALTLKFAVTDSLHRIFPHTRITSGSRGALDAARGERVSFQIAVQNTGEKQATVKLELHAPAPLKTRIRRVGYVPVPHLNTDTPVSETDGRGLIPGLVPDPLFDEDTLTCGPFETNAFWCNVSVPRDARAKKYPLACDVTLDGKVVSKLRLDLTVHDVEINPRANFPVVQWFYADALCDYYKVEPFNDAFWKIVEPYMRNMAEHFQDCMYVPLFTPPTDGVKRPTQLLKVSRDGASYSFDWSDVKRWTDLSQAVGLRYFEWTHLFTQWGVKHAIRIYDTNGNLLWEPETGATSETYRVFLSQFLPEFKQFLEQERLLERSFFHVSDEPSDSHIENYKQARALLKELAPWIKTMDALSHIEFARLTDLPIPICSNSPAFDKEQIKSGVYYCCFPRGKYLNRLMDTPLAKIRMHGWLFWRFQPALFLHWGYNYWHKAQTTQLIDPFSVSDGMKWPGWAHGDTFCVYPGPTGPIDSVRWEIFAESMQDFALLQTLDVKPGDRLLSRIHDYADFPKTKNWIANARRNVLKRK